MLRDATQAFPGVNARIYIGKSHAARKQAGAGAPSGVGVLAVGGQAVAVARLAVSRHAIRKGYPGVNASIYKGKPGSTSLRALMGKAHVAKRYEVCGVNLLQHRQKCSVSGPALRVGGAPSRSFACGACRALKPPSRHEKPVSLFDSCC